jgi:hypothetical protein
MTKQFGKTNIWGVLVGMSCLSVFHVVSSLVTAAVSDPSAKTLQFVSQCGLQTLTFKSLTHFLVDSTHFQTRCLIFAVILKENNWINTESSCKTNYAAPQPKREASPSEDHTHCILQSLVMKLTERR